MSQPPVPIYTCGDNDKFVQITLEVGGWLIGMRSDKTACAPISFMDVNYKKPDFNRHLAMVKEHLPRFAVVPDLSNEYVSKEDVLRALHQAEQLTPYCETVLIVPKLAGQLAMIPPDFVIGYSVPSENGEALYYPWQHLRGRRVHILGGSPHFQMRLYRFLQGKSTINSVDGNMAQKMGWLCKYWSRQCSNWVEHPLKAENPDERHPDLPYECVRLSLENIRDAWLNKEPELPANSLWSIAV